MARRHLLITGLGDVIAVLGILQALRSLIQPRAGLADLLTQASNLLGLLRGEAFRSIPRAGVATALGLSARLLQAFERFGELLARALLLCRGALGTPDIS